MSRLFLLNLLLLAGIAYASLRLMDLRDETAMREELVRSGAPKLPAAKPAAAVPMPERTMASNYLDVAARLLFSKDRNPTVIIAPAPVKQMPELPLAYGVLMLADPPIIMLAEKKGAPQKGYHAGDPVGEFKIVNFDARSIVLAWDGKQYTKLLAEIADRDAKTQQVMAQNTPQETPAAPPTTGGTTVMTTKGGPGSKEFGPDIGGDMRACNPADDSPAGTIRDGYKKVESGTPFGRVCRWEKVK